MGQSGELGRDGEATKVSYPTVEEKGQDGDVPVTSDESSVSNTGGLAGVEKIQATTKTWTKPWLIAAYTWYVA